MVITKPFSTSESAIPNHSNGGFSSPPDTPSNLIAFLFGDDESLKHYMSRLFRSLRARDFSLHDAEDAFQEAMLRAIQWYADGRLAAHPYPQRWLFKVAVNIAYTNARRLHELTARSLPDPVILPFVALDDAEEKQFRLASVHRAVNRLPMKQRQVVTHCDIEGQTIKDAAAQFGMTLGAASGHLTRARQSLRAQLVAATVTRDSAEKPRAGMSGKSPKADQHHIHQYQISSLTAQA